MTKEIIQKKKSKREKRLEKRTLKCKRCHTRVEPHDKSKDYCIDCYKFSLIVNPMEWGIYFGKRGR